MEPGSIAQIKLESRVVLLDCGARGGDGIFFINQGASEFFD